MGQGLRGGATTTQEACRAIQPRRASLGALAKRYGLDPKTIAKRRRTSVADRRAGPKEPRPIVLSVEAGAVVVAFRRHTLPPLDDRLCALQATIPHLTRSSPRRCLLRHGIGRLTDTDGDGPRRSRFETHPPSDVHILIAEAHTAEGRLYLFVAIDRTTEFTVVELRERATCRVTACADGSPAVPYTVHTALSEALHGSKVEGISQPRAVRPTGAPQLAFPQRPPNPAAPPTPLGRLVPPDRVEPTPPDRMLGVPSGCPFAS